MGRRVHDLLAVARSGLRHGRTPPAEWYHSDALFELELRGLFRRCWQLLSTEPLGGDDVQASAHRWAGGSVVLLPDDRGVARSFVNACPHRGTELLADGERNAGRTLRCPYHGWRFDRSGTWLGAPGTPDDAGGDLVELRSERCGDLVFVSADPSVPALPHLTGDLTVHLRHVGIDLSRLHGAVRRSSTIDLDCNWKLAVENTLECYHCAVAHPQMRRTADLSSGESLERSPVRIAGRYRAPGGGADRRVSHQSHWLFPNQSIAAWPSRVPSVVVNRWIPLSPVRTRWDISRYWLDDIACATVEEEWEYTLEFCRQDADIVAAVQRGVQNGWSGGRFVLAGARPEHGPHLFLSGVVAMLSGGSFDELLDEATT